MEQQEAVQTRPVLSITVTVNGDPVELHERRPTGLEIKQAAVNQGVAIGLDWVLSVVRGHKHHVVGDTDEIAVHDGLEFVAVPGDDNS